MTKRITKIIKCIIQVLVIRTSALKLTKSCYRQNNFCCYLKGKKKKSHLLTRFKHCGIMAFIKKNNIQIWLKKEKLPPCVWWFCYFLMWYLWGVGISGLLPATQLPDKALFSFSLKNKEIYETTHCCSFPTILLLLFLVISESWYSPNEVTFPSGSNFICWAKHSWDKMTKTECYRDVYSNMVCAGLVLTHCSRYYIAALCVY